MRICFFSGDVTRSGGMERVLSTLTTGLLAGNDEHVYSILSLKMEKRKPFFQFDKRIELETLNISEKQSPLSKMTKVVKGLREYVLRNDIDVLIDVDTILSVYSVPALAFTKTKHISWEHFTYKQDLGVRYRNWGRSLAGRFSDGIVVLTQKDKKEYSLNPLIKRPVYHIYNPILLEEKSNENLEIERKMILSAGRLTYQKGFDLLIEVAELVFKEHPDWVWIIAGEGEDREKLEAKIVEKGLERNIFLAGIIENMDEYYSQASIFVLTSRFEPFGLVLTEAKAHHLPCVSFDVDAGPSEIIIGDVNGYLIDPFDISEMALKINYLIEHPEIRRYQAMNALVGTDKFDMKKIIHEWEELFQSIA